MKAMCIDEKRNFVWQDVPDPKCHDEFDVKIRIRACALNRADLMQRQGIYAPPEGWPLWPGLKRNELPRFERGENRGKVVLTV